MGKLHGFHRSTRACWTTSMDEGVCVWRLQCIFQGAAVVGCRLIDASTFFRLQSAFPSTCLLPTRRGNRVKLVNVVELFPWNISNSHSLSSSSFGIVIIFVCCAVPASGLELFSFHINQCSPSAPKWEVALIDNQAQLPASWSKFLKNWGWSSDVFSFHAVDDAESDSNDFKMTDKRSSRPTGKFMWEFSRPFQSFSLFFYNKMLL